MVENIDAIDNYPDLQELLVQVYGQILLIALICLIDVHHNKCESKLFSRNYHPGYLTSEYFR